MKKDPSSRYSGFEFDPDRDFGAPAVVSNLTVGFTFIGKVFRWGRQVLVRRPDGSRPPGNPGDELEIRYFNNYDGPQR